MTSLTPKQKEIAKLMVKYPMEFCCPCFFGAVSNPTVDNGTMTLITYQGKRYGITNYHVVDAYRKRLEQEPEIHFHAGSTTIDVDNALVWEDEKLDLSVLCLEAYPETLFSSGSEIPTSFLEVSNMDDGEAKVGDFVMFGGFPYIWRSRPDEGSLVFDTFSSGASEVTDVTETTIICSLAEDKCVAVPLDSERESTPENFGGISGGPVFLQQFSEGGFETYKLIGLIFEYVRPWDVIRIRKLSMTAKHI